MTLESRQKKHNRPEEVAQAVQVLRRGGVVGYPSETVWGLAALPTSRAAVERLYALKGREASKPVQLSCLNMQRARGWLRPGQDELERLEVFWPGPLTVLAWATETCPPWLAPGGTLATTSLNPSGSAAASSQKQAQAYGLADLLLSADGDEASTAQWTSAAPVGSRSVSSGVASTVFDLRTRQVLRLGAVPHSELLAALV